MTYYQPVKPLNRFWLCPLPAIDEGLACVPSGYQPPHVEPENQTLIERMLYSVNKTPEDAEWLSEYFADLPSYLTKYFAKRYIETHKEQGAQAANSYIREKMRPASERVKLVMDSYKHLPDSKKVASLRKRLDELDDEEQFNSNVSIFTSNKYQLGFDFDLSEKQKTKQKKQVKVRILAELELDELRDMAFTISNVVNKRAQFIGVQHGKETEEQLDEALPSIYEDVATLVRELGITPPRKYKEQTAESAITDISRMVCEKWWFGRLKSIRKIMREHLAIAMGQVSAKASPYASWDCIREHQETQKKNWEALQQRLLKDEETGEEAELSDTVLKSVSNPAIRRHELMTRCRGCEDVGNMLELQGLFLTLTTPSVFHNHYKKGSFIPHWNGASPRGAQEYLNNVWQRIRAKLGRDEIRWFGIRVAEPHHDGTPHWHLLIWVQPEHVAKVRDVFISYAIKEDKEELYPFFDRNEKRAAKKQSIQGPFNYRPRCDFGLIDPEKGTATGYIAKYISKNIDGFAMDGEVSDETGKSVQAMAKNVNAWKSRWGIRQFQFFGGAPVTTYRELRRLANQNKKAFMEYVFNQQREDLINIYLMSHYQLVGPFKPARKMKNAELLEVISNNYEARMSTDDASVSETMKSADQGNWKGYIMGQGGPFVKREDLLITNSYEVLPFASPHGEDVRKIEGVVASGDLVKTRLRTWTITKKTKKNTETVYEFDKPSENPITWRLKGKKVTSKETIEAEAGALAPALDLALSGISDSSRSSVNNCTPSQKVQVSDQLKRLLEPYSVGGGLPPNIDDSALIALQQGCSIRIDDETSIRIRPAEHLPCGTVRPAQLVEEYQPKPDLSWLAEMKPEPKPLNEDEYTQPDLSLFSDDLNDYPECEEWPLYEE